MALPLPSKSARALVTGASQGIGLAIAKDLARYGHNLILVARREDVLKEIATDLEKKHGVIVEVRPVDLSDEQARKVLIDEIKTREINIIINSAASQALGRSRTRIGLMRRPSSHLMPLPFLSSPTRCWVA